ncbi:NAD-dependent epimerase/dehydratase family protein [Hydrogenophaga sp. 5NK40-0174]|uniref:NAD-dependent epimerase/dehydratase family protein n=1 Tax=Hydrogenophaga sp. 5NK40-0174 TaxID=3127649 RepID=UPI00310299AD
MIGITGATGFVGQALCREMMARQLVWRGFSQSGKPVLGVPTQSLSLAPETDWRGALQGLECVIHCAARVHQMDASAAADEQAFQRINTHGTVRLAQSAADAGVRRLIFLSSVKAMGEYTLPGHPFQHDTKAEPQDAYGRSKLDAEKGLHAVARATGIEIVVVRPPLVYGPGVGANFRALMRAVARGIPLPLEKVDNRRSLIGVQNLADLLLAAARHPGAAGQTFLASDGEDLSTPDLIRRLAKAMGRPARLLPVPSSWLGMGARMVGKSAQWERLSQSLQVDIGHTMQVMDWKPKWSVQQGLELTVGDVLR